MWGSSNPADAFDLALFVTQLGSKLGFLTPHLAGGPTTASWDPSLIRTQGARLLGPRHRLSGGQLGSLRRPFAKCSILLEV
jgi:hypothetical protein